jgi:hypothetical protein
VKRKSQAAAIGAILLTSMVLIGIIVFFNKVNFFLKNESQKNILPLLKSKSIEISKTLNDLIRFRGERYITYDIPNTLFYYYTKGNTTFLAIKTQIAADMVNIEPLTDNKYYYEVCKIQGDELIGCFFQGLKLKNLTKFCVPIFKELSKTGNIFYCINQRVYTVKEKGGNKFLVSVYPSPRINLPANNNICNAYLVNLDAKKQILFICDFFIYNGKCYFPKFVGSFAAYPREGENLKIKFKYEGLQEIPNMYTFCKRSFLFKIKVSKE